MNIWDFAVACGAQTAVFLAPKFLQEYIYRRILHKPMESDQKTTGTNGKRFIGEIDTNF